MRIRRVASDHMRPFTASAAAAVLLIGSTLFSCLAVGFAYGLIRSNRLLLAKEQDRFQQETAVDDDTTAGHDEQQPCLTPELVGKWIPIRERRSPELVSINYTCVGLSSGCACNFVETHVWESPILRPWDPQAFCRALGNRTILLIGDSTMKQTAFVLQRSVQPAGCHDQILQAPGDTLIQEPMGALNRGLHWMDVVEEYRPDICILTAGAHIAHQGNFTKMIDDVIEGIVGARTAYPSMKVVWKTQNPAGRDESMIHLHPFEAAQRPDGGYRNYNHHLFWDRDNEAIEKLQVAGIPFLDMRMMYSRTHAHPMELQDYLHACIPGPITVFPQLVQKVVLDDRFEVAGCLPKKNPEEGYPIFGTTS